MKWIIYGAYGYTGQLIVKEALRLGLRPILAGGNKNKLEELAKETGLKYENFDLNETNLHERFKGIELLLNCAGPFSKTFYPLVHACLKSKTHYLDITGEIDIFEQAHKLDSQARNAAIIICPGVGFDVVPTDCLSMKLKKQLPDATSLELSFSGQKSVSPGTAKTMLEQLGHGTKVRRQGKIISASFGRINRMIDFGSKEMMGTSIPWGDVASAYFTTNIKNITVYAPLRKNSALTLRSVNLIAPLIRTKIVKTLLSQFITRAVKGPKASSRGEQNAYIWGEVRNDKGQTKSAVLKTPNGYDLTARASTQIVKHILKTNGLKGYLTPALLMGENFIDEFTLEQRN